MLDPNLFANRMGGVEVFVTAAPDQQYFRLEYVGSWYYDESYLLEEIKSDRRCLENYTLGHDKDPNHRWVLVGHEIHRLHGVGHCDAVCILYYRPVNPEFLREYAGALSKFKEELSAVDGQPKPIADTSIVSTGGG